MAKPYDPDVYRARKEKGLCVYCGKQPRWTNESGRLLIYCKKCQKDTRRRAAVRLARHTRRRTKQQLEKPHLILGTRAGSGAKMTKGNGWKLLATKGKTRWFAGSLIASRNIGGARIAIFSVRK